MEIRNYALDIEINEEDLEGEWLTHPSIYAYYTEAFADSVYKRDDAKLKLEWVEAQIDLDIRQKWETKYKLPTKPTEAAIKNIIKTNKKYLNSMKKYNKCVKRVNSLQGIKNAFDHKKHALSNLVSLQISGFYAEPRNKVRDLQKHISATNHSQHKRELNESLKRRKKKK